MANKQIQLLEWIYDNRNNFPLESGKIYQAYQETESYQSRQNSFSELLSKLADKEFLEKTDYATYDISLRGKRRIESLRNEEKEIKKPDGYGDLVDELTYFLHEEKEDELQRASVRGNEFKLRLSELESFNSEILDSETFRTENYGSSAIEEAIENVLILDSDESVDYRIVPDVDFLEKDLRKVISRKHIGELVIVEGMIKKSEKVSQLIVSADFQCTNCGEVVEKEQNSPKLKSPYKCECCGSRKLEVYQRYFTDVVDFSLSQRDQKETTLDARIKGTLGIKHQKALMTGNKVRVLGIPEVKSDGDKKKQKKVLQVLDYQRVDVKKDLDEFDSEKRQEVLEKIQVSEDPFRDFYESLAPTVGGMELPKKAIALSLVGCPRFEDMNEDGRIHTGIITNPGLGKSKLQNWVNETFGKTQIADGPSSSSAGLTATVEQNKGNEWQVVAGKLVFAHKGILQLDEFDKYPEGELTSLNSAMEDGEFKLAKASVQASLPGEATVIATGNFSRKLDSHTKAYEILPEKGQGLYDRFSLLVGVTEQGDEPKRKISSGFSKGTSDVFDVEFSEEELRIFRNIVRDKMVYLSDEANQVLRDFDDASNSKENRDVEGTSNRDFVQLIKLTLAIARFSLRDEATAEDARRATKIIRECRQSLDLELGEKASEKNRQHNRLNDFDDAYDKLADANEKIDLTSLESKFVSEFNHDKSEFEDALQIKTGKEDFMKTGNKIQRLA